LEGLGAEAVNAVADREFGGAEEVAVVLARQQARQLEGFVRTSGFEPLEEGLGLGFLFGGEVQCGHEESSRWGGMSGCPSDRGYSREFAETVAPSVQVVVGRERLN
jgi:hypothetical protein